MSCDAFLARRMPGTRAADPRREPEKKDPLRRVREKMAHFPRPRLANSAPWDSWPARPAARPRALYFQERGGLPQRCVKPTKTGNPARNYLPRLKKGVLVPAGLKFAAPGPAFLEAIALNPSLLS